MMMAMMTVVTFARVSATMARPDRRDGLQPPPDGRIGLEASVRGLRIAYSGKFGYVKNVGPEIAAAARTAAGRITELGAIVEEKDPGFGDPRSLGINWASVPRGTLSSQSTP
ncbi:MAG: hypothetical protein FJX57_11140 [Alphaproteobacteria bacterium]|nr:hypothetical protein [Alphaproteobacteria bacterium]